MSPRRLILLVCSVLGLGLSNAFAAAPLEASVYKHTNKRIEALFHLRDEPLTFVNARNNPFRPPGTMSSSVVVAASDEVPEDVELTDADLLRLAVAPLKITGVMHVGNQIRLTINRSNYAVGDILQVKLNGETLDLRIVNIAEKSVTFRLNETDFVLNF
jgi:hypothetical protein